MDVLRQADGTVAVLRQPWFVECAVGLAACALLFGEGTCISRWSITTAFSVSTSTDPLSGGWGIIAAFLAVVAVRGRARRVRSSHGLPAVLGVLAGSAVLVMFAADFGVFGMREAGSLAQVIADASAIALGFFSTLMLVLWADALVPLGARASSQVLGWALAVIVLADAILCACTECAAALLATLSAIASPAMLVRARSGVPREAIDLGTDGYRGVVPAWAVFSTVALLGLAMGVVQSGATRPGGVLPLGESLGQPFTLTLLTDAGTLIAAVAVLCSERLLVGNDLRLYRWGILCLLTVSTFLSAVVAPEGFGVPVLLMTVLRVLAFAYVWALFSIPARSASPAGLFSAGWLVFLVPNVAVTRLGRLTAADPVLNGLLAVALVALFAVEYVATAGRGAFCGTPNDASFSDRHASDVLRRARVVAESHLLTRREEEVLVLLMQGRSRSFIADALMISPETVRTHVRNIYAKLDVHSRDEFVDKAFGIDEQKQSVCQRK